MHDTSRWPGGSAWLLVKGACCGKKNNSKTSKMVQTLIQLIFQGLMHVQHKKPFLVSSLKPVINSTNKSLRRLSIPDLPLSSASTLLKPDSTLLESRSKLAGTLQKISPPTLKMLCFNTLESFHINMNLKFRLSLICTKT